MARKNNVKSEHPGSILFDTRTRAVMAGPDSNDNIKEKVQSVREVVPGKSNNEIVLVLQYYDYNVEKAIQAYLEDGAKEALGEWHVPPAKPKRKQKNKKKAASNSQADNGMSTSAGGGAAAASVPASSSQPLPQRVPSASNGVSSIISGSSSSSSKSPLPNGDIYTGSIKGLEVTNSALLEGAAAAGPPLSTSASVSPPKPYNHRIHAGSHGHGQAHGHAQRTRTASERSTASNVGAGGDNHSRRPFHGLEKSIKDLQRQTTSLERLRLLLEHEIERSYRSIKSVFDEMRTHLNTREKQMMTEMDLVKQQANEVFKMRQEKAAMLKVHIERAEKLSDSELGDLRADVKHFVADRKIDEELGKTTRFQYDSDHLKEEILSFGEVMPVKCTYTARRPSVSSVASSGPGTEDAQPPLALHADPVPAATVNSSQVQDSYQITSEEQASLQMRLQNSLKIQGYLNDGQPPANGSSSSASVDDDSQKKSARRKNRNRERQEQGTTEEESLVTSSPLGESVSDSRAATPSSTRASAGSSSPSPQRGQRSPRQGGMYRGRGRGVGDQGPGGYRGGQNQGRPNKGRGSPRRPYSGGGGRGGARGGGRGGGGDQHRGMGAGPVPVVVNGSAS